MKRIFETSPQTFVENKYNCIVEAFEVYCQIGTQGPLPIKIARGEGFGSNYETARDNAYRELAGVLLEKFTTT